MCVSVCVSVMLILYSLCFGCHVGRYGSIQGVCVDAAVLTVFEDTDEQGFVGVTVPPVSWDLGMERLGNPDIQLTVAEINMSNH